MSTSVPTEKAYFEPSMRRTKSILIYGSDSSPDKLAQDDHAATDDGRTATDSNADGPAYPVSGCTDTRGSQEHENGETRLYGNRRSPSGTYPHHRNFDDDNTSLSSDEKDVCSGTSSSEKPFAVCTEQRTIAIRGLSERTTHHDITEVVRGGALLEIFLRTRDRMASVSFVEGSAAQEFLNYAKRRDVYILGKRVEVSWSDRQFFLTPYVGAKISNGASRNLVIHSVNPNITEERIRRDLDHIHNLIVINVQYHQGNAYISTNSVHNALFARSCMMSRVTYKGMKIGFYPDECAGPIPRVQAVPKNETAAPVKKVDPPVNRFQILSVDGADDSGDEDGELASYASFGGGIRWTDNSIAA
ncbi:hypothetical protein VTN00DRAFT_227 [Thermoascus crustaceus]|uniref:uncharacterized protein n=1 Tax=Thermoascus crustaceus TaxID=5088 RepID=UPI003742677E